MPESTSARRTDWEKTRPSEPVVRFSSARSGCSTRPSARPVALRNMYTVSCQCVGQHHAFDARVRDVALVPEGDVFQPRLQIAPQHSAESAETFGEDRDCACAASTRNPSGPAVNGSSASPTSLRARWRTSSANDSIAVPSDAHA